MKILFIGDVVGQPGRRAVRVLAPKLRLRHNVDYVIANGENSAGGSGITTSTSNELLEAGVDVITTGDHVWDQKESTDLLDKQEKLLRPANYPQGVPGRGTLVLAKEGRPTIGVMNLQGRTFIPPHDNPFLAAQNLMLELRKQTKIIFVDMHAEATSEKIAMGRMLDGFVSAVVGTHTHVQTADEQIFPGGTAFLCDAGFTGPHESILGREIEPVIRRFQTGLPQRFEVARSRIFLQGALVEINETTGKAISIVRISEALPDDGDNR